MSAMRLVSALPMFYLLMDRSFATCFFVFLVASVTDFLDGYSARRLNICTSLGSALDPLADKVLMCFFYYGAYKLKAIPLWLFLLIISRDIFIIIFAACMMMAKSIRLLKPSFVSKINTCFQLALALTILLDFCAGNSFTKTVSEALIWIVGTMTLFSGIQYLVSYLRSHAT
ncbi:MAG: CDP-alcohol phosphatidyltransferase family protein [Holosporales bacterium]|nr:CDP-alcohol phosphatidyltransferase family protein [Holosporales bacterium]